MAEDGKGFLGVLLGTVSTVLTGTIQALHQVVEQGYQRGYQDGAAAMRDSLLRAAEAPLKLPPMPPITSFVNFEKDAEDGARVNRRRAPRGAVGRFIRKTLMDGNGRTQQELEEMAASTEGLSASSVGNELRRGDGTKYHRDNLKRWRLILAPSESAGAPDEAPPAQEVYLPAA